MAFESLTDKLQNVFKNLRGKGRLSEDDVKAALKEVKMALLEADVNFKVVKQFVSSVQERAVGEDVLNGLNPGQMVIKIVNEEMTALMGSETTELKLLPINEITVIMMCGLQGAGKTTTAAKIAGKLKMKGRKPLLAACDIYRPAAIDQLKINAEKQQVDFFSMGTDVSPVEIAKSAIDQAKKNGNNVVIVDTAGRLQIDEAMMKELCDIKEAIEVHQSLLVVDAMTGQDAVNVASQFNEKVGIDGIILSKMDGDSRGGAALSTKSVTGKPILYVGMGEKLSDLEQFYPDRMASRILGMGDVLSLIDKAVEANAERDAEKDKEMAAKMKKGKIDFEMYLESMKQMRNMGGLSSIMGMLPGMGKISDDQLPDEKKLAKMEAIVLSMTPEERKNPKLMNPQRKFRIAKGSGNDIADVNRFIKQFDQMQKMMKQMPGLMGGKKGGFGKFGGLGGFGGFGKNKFF
ncbi:MAG: signal recognition particle protein [Butyrivibrio sp.]|uniref:Signal recognition particle protein n=1 Tax=Butyrivibrio hungatei TaxID=185008 RepID=A0A1G5EJK3_9FIRM|nr:signal recognition particle protein [Butyrivibrio hungatei]MBQ4218477.1 signal recognition particle protein [Butyrivibrio sp.]MCR4996441.1 signal recognition particle protein [Butyrivibrio sp.]MEE3469604.1 signal recognition particle protein [Butyrivibrio hungatei]SCY27147.1 signal recognition particle subunit FFH/SRP54 (srp54) [Butyrivibrio hungatei]